MKKAKWHHGPSRRKAAAKPTNIRREIYKVFQSVGSRGTHWHESAGCADTDESLFLRRLRGSSEKRLETSLQVLRRWHAWAKHENVKNPGEGQNALSPSANFMGKFLLSVVTGGPTAAAQVWAHLEWWRTKVGLPFPTQAHSLSSFKTNEPGHRIRQAIELPAWVFLNFIIMAKKLSGPRAIMIKIILFTTMSCIRWEHILRSHILEICPGQFRCRCTLGKNRISGTRAPFDFWTPSRLSKDDDTLRDLIVFYEGRRSTLVPDIQMESGVINETSGWRSRPMPGKKFIQALRTFAEMAGVGHEDAKGLTFNTLRRFLPTLGEAVDLSPPELQSLSNWVESVKTTERQKPRASNPIYLRYAADKDTSAFLNKHKIIVAMQTAVEIFETKRSSTKGLWLPKSILWSTLRTLRPDIERSEVAVVSGPPWSEYCLDASVPSQDLTKARKMLEEAEWKTRRVTEPEDADVGTAVEHVVSDGASGIGTDLFRTNSGRWHFQRRGTKKAPIAFCHDLALHGEPRFLPGSGRFPREGLWCRQCVARMQDVMLQDVRAWSAFTNT